MRALAITTASLLALITPVSADILFTDDFEADLSQWVGKNGGVHHGVIVPDPVDPSNHAVLFTQVNDTGNIFGTEISISSSEVYTLSFDYLGYPRAGSPPGNFGGFIGIADESVDPLSAATVRFLAGTINENSILLEHIDDGTWHSYSIAFNPYSLVTVTDDAIRITMEDWNGPGLCSCQGVPGDAYFDNVRLERTGPVETATTTWGRIKAQYR